MCMYECLHASASNEGLVPTEEGGASDPQELRLQVVGCELTCGL